MVELYNDYVIPPCRNITKTFNVMFLHRLEGHRLDLIGTLSCSSSQLISPKLRLQNNRHLILQRTVHTKFIPATYTHCDKIMKDKSLTYSWGKFLLTWIKERSVKQ